MSQKFAKFSVALALVVLTAAAMLVAKVQAATPRTPKEVKEALVGGWFGATKTDNVYLTFDGENAAQVGLYTPQDKFRVFMGGGTIKYAVSDSGTISFSGNATGTVEFAPDGTLKLHMDLQGPNRGEYYQVYIPLRKVTEFKQGMMPGPRMMAK